MVDGVALANSFSTALYLLLPVCKFKMAPRVPHLENQFRLVVFKIISNYGSAFVFTDSVTA